MIKIKTLINVNLHQCALYSLKYQAELSPCPSFQEKDKWPDVPHRGRAEDTPGKFIGGVDEHQLSSGSRVNLHGNDSEDDVLVATSNHYA